MGVVSGFTQSKRCATAIVLWAVALTTVCCPSEAVLEVPITRRPGGHDIRERRLHGRELHFEESFSKRENDGVYWADIRIGSPPQMFSVILDTGSSTIAIPCKGCSCGNHNHFDRSISPTTVTAAAGGYSQCYSEGSCNRGDLVKDFVCLGEKCDPKSSVQHAFGCCNTFASAFKRQEADGIIGLSLRSGTLISDLRDHHKLDSDLFALCFGELNGHIAVGGYPKERHLEPVQWTKMTGSTGEFYRVNVKGMYVDGNKVDASGSTSIVDSGSTFTYVPYSFHSSLKNTFIGYCNSSPNHCKGPLNPSSTPAADKRDSVACFQYPGESTLDFESWLDSFPHVELEMGDGVKICLPSSNYFFKSSKDIFCVGIFADRKWVIGAITLAQFDVVFNHNEGTIGWARANCDGASDEPASPVSCCGSCAEHQDFTAATQAPHIEKHEVTYKVVKLKNGHLKLVPNDDVGLQLSGVTLKDGDELWLDRPGNTFVLCADSEPCSFPKGSSINVAKGTTVMLGSSFKLDGALNVLSEGKIVAVDLMVDNPDAVIRLEPGSFAESRGVSIKRGELVLSSSSVLDAAVTVAKEGILSLPSTKVDATAALVAVIVGSLDLFGEIALETGGRLGKLQVDGKVSVKASRISFRSPVGLRNLPEDYFLDLQPDSLVNDYVLVTTSGQLHGPINIEETKYSDEVLKCSAPEVVQEAKYVSISLPQAACIKACLIPKRDMQGAQQERNSTEACVKLGQRINKLYQVLDGVPASITVAPTEHQDNSPPSQGLSDMLGGKLIPILAVLCGLLTVLIPFIVWSRRQAHKYAPLELGTHN